MALITKYISDLNVIEVFFLIIMGWILIDLWVTFYNNLFYRTIGLNHKSAYHNLVLAFFTTIAFFTFMSLFNDIANDFINYK